MWDNTLVMMMSDNGGPIYGGQGGNNHPLRGGKLDAWEGGIRVNAFASGGLIPAPMRGKTTSHLTALADVYATLCEVAGVDPTDTIAAKAGIPPIDSVSLWPLLSGRNATGPRDDYFDGGVLQTNDGMKLLTGQVSDAVWTGPLYPNSTTDYGNQSGTVGDCSHGCLYNVSDATADIGEHVDLAGLPAYAGVHARMVARLKALRGTGWSPKRDKSTVPDMCAKARATGGYWAPFLPE